MSCHPSLTIVEHFEVCIAELRQELAPYADGWRAYDRRGNDISESHIQRVEGDIAEYERCIAARKKRRHV